jgi:hypothetical protein
MHEASSTWHVAVRCVITNIARSTLALSVINTTTLQLEDFPLRDIRPYALLSHTWAEAMLTVYTFLPDRFGC